MIEHHETVFAVSGATGVIGNAIARALATDPGASLVLIARDGARAAKAAEAIREASGNDRVRFEIADLSRKESIRTLAQSWQGPLHVLVNVAGVAPRKRTLTAEGIELTFATNVLGYVWMTEALAPHLERSAPARVVDVASYYAGDLDLDDLEFERRRYDNHAAYRQSKQANRMLSSALAERMSVRGIRVNACHPGDPPSVLSRNLGFGGSQSAEQAARTPVMLARGEIGADATGRYFEHGRETRCRFAADREAVERLYAICHTYD